jgi:SAM-dependent methyltransferase
LIKFLFFFKLLYMGYVYDFKDAVAYEQWLHNPRNQITAELESRLMLDMLKPAHGESMLDIGCGAGASLLPFLEMGLQLTGLDPSPYMLDIAVKKIENRADFHRGFAEDLPFEDNSFNFACLITTLEFVKDPKKAIEEACRVAKDRIFIGILNRYAIKGIQRKVKGIFKETIYNHAHFFSIWELKKMIRFILGDVPISWKTVCQFPTPSGKIIHRLEQSNLVQRCPFGAFVGIAVILVPRYRTRPLSIKYHTKHTRRAVVG